MSVAQHRDRLHRKFFGQYDGYLDRCHKESSIDLSNETLSGLLRENLDHHHATKYGLLAYCIMPNHVHVLLQPFEKKPVVEAASFDAGAESSVPSDEVADSASPLASIMHSLKSCTANECNRALNRSGQFWQHESYDHWVRDLDELRRIVDYIRLNPVRAGLCRRPHDWVPSSSYDCFVKDGSYSGLVSWLRDDWMRE